VGGTSEPDETSGAGKTGEAGDEVEKLLARAGYDEDETLLTRRQAEVLVMREQGHTQAEIAQRIETTRENVTGIEARARENVDKARETVRFVERLSAPVQVEISTDTDLYDVPELVYEACDEKGIKIPQNGPELMKIISDGAGAAVDGRQIRTPLLVSVTSNGAVQIRPT
jgi:Tfx family DNA-binding protein